MYLVFILSYLIGSISPGYILGKLIKGIDIRNYGNRNTGATNTFRAVGPVPGAIAVTFDLIKAPLAYYLAFNYFGLSFDFSILAGLSAVAGHIFPFYLTFRGGRGTASLYGLSIFSMIIHPSWTSLALLCGTIAYSLIISSNIVMEAPLRKILKLAGMIFPLGLFWFTEDSILLVVGLLLGISIVFDLARLLLPKLNEKYLRVKIFSKRKEANFFSGTTFLLGSIFLVIYFFSNEIAIFTLVSFMIADVLAPVGQYFLPKKLLKEKTFGGFLIVFSITIASGLYLNFLTSLTLPFDLIIKGALLLAILDQLSFVVDDNLLVPLGAAGLLSLRI